MSAASELAPQAFAAWARIWAARSGAQAAQVRQAGQLAQAVSIALLEGHSCLVLADSTFAGLSREEVLATGIVAPAHEPGAFPLLLDAEGRLYVHRYHDYERRLAHWLALALAPTPASGLPIAVTQLLDTLYPGLDEHSVPDLQKQAVQAALTRRFLLISGGPGTGKTSTVVNLLACLLTLAPATHVVLAAPTGKAAARMQQALRLRASALPEALRQRLPTEAGTVHRLLGYDPHSGRFAHHRDAPLVLDALVVDEASMLDLALATRLCEALPAHARLILLGDRDQLAAVESGAVFAELTQPGALADVVRFERQFRFGADSVVGTLASATRQGDAGALLACLAQPNPELDWEASAAAPDGPGPVLLTRLLAGYEDYFAALEHETDPLLLFAAFERFRVLCALRAGPWGAATLSEALSRLARRRIDAPPEAGFDSPWYRGRPVMVQRNDALLRLFNGDIGIALPNADGELQLAFPAADGGVSWIAPSRLPEHETAFALTVHKSQGSEFERVAVVLPPEPSPLLTRELLYTAITRARRKILLLARPDRIREAVANPTRRASGLLARLREAGPP